MSWTKKPGIIIYFKLCLTLCCYKERTIWRKCKCYMKRKVWQNSTTLWSMFPADLQSDKQWLFFFCHKSLVAMKWFSVTSLQWLLSMLSCQVTMSISFSHAYFPVMTHKLTLITLHAFLSSHNEHFLKDCSTVRYRYIFNNLYP